MKSLDNQGRLLIPHVLLNLVGYTPPCDVLLIKDSEKIFYLVETESPYKFNKKIVNKMRIDEKGRVPFRSYILDISEDWFSKNFDVSAILEKDGNNRIEIELVP